MQKRPKYRNRKTVLDGVAFDSAKEAKRWAELLLLEKAGVIRELRRQVSYPLDVNGRRVCRYIADFSYHADGVEVTEDVKSEYTRKLPVYRIKAKLFRAIYGREIQEV